MSNKVDWYNKEEWLFKIWKPQSKESPDLSRSHLKESTLTTKLSKKLNTSQFKRNILIIIPSNTKLNMYLRFNIKPKSSMSHNKKLILNKFQFKEPTLSTSQSRKLLPNMLRRLSIPLNMLLKKGKLKIFNTSQSPSKSFIKILPKKFHNSSIWVNLSNKSNKCSLPNKFSMSINHNNKFSMSNSHNKFNKFNMYNSLNKFNKSNTYNKHNKSSTFNLKHKFK